MPKSNKHKAARKADFARAKLKLGKGKQVASNSTNTSFSSKSIGLPNQSITQLKSGPTTPKNHTLEDLLIQSKHYSTSVKKDALLELQQLLINYPFLLLQHLLPLFSILSHLISDPASSIRNLSLILLKFIFDTVSLDLLSGTSAGLILFTISALSSLNEGIRLSALRILDLLLEKVPGEIVAGWNDSSFLVNQTNLHQEQEIGNQVVEALLGVLRVRKNGLQVGEGGFTSASNGGELSPSTRSATLTTLSSFLQIALSTNVMVTSSLPWYLATSFSTSREFNTFLSLSTLSGALAEHGSNTAAELEIVSARTLISRDFENFALSDLSTALSFKPSEVGVTLTSLPTIITVKPASLLYLLSPTLLSSFLDSAPSAFLGATTSSMSTSTSNDHHIETVYAAMNIAKQLYSHIFHSRDTLYSGEMSTLNGHNEHKKTLVVFLTHVGVYFPFDGDRYIARKSDVIQMLIQLNVIFSSLVSLLILQENSEVSIRNSSYLPVPSFRSKSSYNLTSKVEQMILKVWEWIIPALKGEVSSESHPMGQKMSAEAFESLEPTMWALMNQSRQDSLVNNVALEVVGAVIEYFEHASSASESKKKCFAFLARVILIKDHAGYINSLGTENISKFATNDWILSLPKYLWELGFKSPDTTKMIMRFFTQLLTRKSLPDSHPTRGSTLGPFVKLPLQIQINSIDLVSHLAQDNREILHPPSNLREAVTIATSKVGGEVAERWCRVLETK